MVEREIAKRILDRVGKGKAIIIMGARQVGKTTMLKNMFAKEDYLWLNGDEIDVQQIFENISSTRLRTIFGRHKIIIIDEAQRISDIGIKLKLITDSIPDVQVIAAGSSSFDLANKVNEPLTGRKWEHQMYPLSFAEMVAHHGIIEESRMIAHRMVYGYYPEVVINEDDPKSVLKQLSDSYLYKDILMWEQIKKPEKLVRLLQALAFQVGSQVSYNELAQLCGIDTKTVEKYVNLLEQIFVIFRLGSFSRNIRNELKSSKKIYFYDNGIRNALIANFAHTENRSDVGALWENFVISERFKYLASRNIWATRWFWRTTSQMEIDYVEESDGLINAYEFKWSDRAKARVPKSFLASYPGSTFDIITPSNVSDFIFK